MSHNDILITTAKQNSSDGQQTAPLDTEWLQMQKKIKCMVEDLIIHIYIFQIDVINFQRTINRWTNGNAFAMQMHT